MKLRQTTSLITLLIAGATSASFATEDTANLKDNSYVTLSGTIGEIMDGDEFMLKTTAGDIKIDTNDEWPGLFDEAAGRLLKTGDRVTVTGEVDKNYFTASEVEAIALSHEGTDYSAVYRSENLNNTTYYQPFWYSYDETNMRLSGMVAEVIDDENFTLNYGDGSIKVGVSDAQIDDTNSLRVGDSVTVYGDVEDGWLSKQEFEADSVIRISRFPLRG